MRSRFPIDESKPLPLLPRLIFASRWLQLPLYFGLIVGISSIHLLESFIAAGTLPDKVLIWQTTIRGMFTVSALAVAMIDRLICGVPHKIRIGGTGRDGAPHAGADHH